ncbi:RidA family protein [Paenibacillus sp. GbtcB18]|uniref:RidA family protein n=1 Tax=Paenibacillus sp. GbtcB18 TaxID=2824763 RepID=UPI001C305749|nr:RidA family protein [Paenibacillus sp. GbtcB18]
MPTPEERLQSLGYILPQASKPAAKYTNFIVANGLLFLSGKGPSKAQQGKLGSDYTTEEGYNFAMQTGLEVFAVLREELGTLDKIKRVIKVQGFVNATPDFQEHHKVLEVFSDLMFNIFMDNGVHARSVLGVVSLRDNLPIIVDSIFEIHE